MAAATSKMERFAIIVNGFITKRSILDVAAALDPPLDTHDPLHNHIQKKIRDGSAKLPRQL